MSVCDIINHGTNLPFMKGRERDFPKRAVIGEWEIFTRNGKKPGMGGLVLFGFIMGGWEIFKVSSHSWWRGANPPVLWRLLPYIAYSLPLFQFLSNPPPHPTSLSPPTPTPTVFSIILLLWLNGWSQHIWCAILLNVNIDLHM